MLRPDVTQLEAFYKTSLGMASCRLLRGAIRAFWLRKENAVQQILGIGYALPYLLPFMEQDKNRIGAVMPAGQGVMHWPRHHKGNLTVLSEESELPFRDESIDKALIIHALEFTEPELFLPELWRTLAPGGQALFIVPSRRGIWNRAETTPFGHGRPYSATQLEQILRSALFTPVSTRTALFVPPVRRRFLLRMAPALERMGDILRLPFGGVVMVLAEKRLHAPIQGNKAPVFAPARALQAGLRRE
jgi:SAM-dependent methyltransferase